MPVQLSPTALDLVRSGLFGKDFDTYRSEIIDFLNARFGSNVATNIVASEQGVMLIEAVAFALSTASYYGDRQADETNLVDARLRYSAVNIARQLGYKPFASVAPVATLTMTITSPTVLPVALFIPKGSQLTGNDGSSWETAQDLTVNPGDPLVQTVVARVGVTLQETFVSDGTPNQFFQLTTIPTGFSIAQSSGMTTVGGLVWPEVEFLTYDQTNQVEVDYGFNPPRLVFGSGIAGNIPPANSQLVFSYFATPGTAGAVTSGTVTTFVNPLIAGTTTITVTLTQPNPSTPGSDPQSIDQIKVVAPLVWSAAKRAVTNSDIDGWINSFIDPIFGAVAIGKANTPRSISADAEALTIAALIQSMGNQLATLDPNTAGASDGVVTRFKTYINKILSSNCKANVIIAQILSADSIGRYVPASAGLAAALETFLDSISVAPAQVKATDGSVNLYSVDLTVNVKLLSAYSSPVAQQTVAATIQSLLQAELIGRSYGDSLRISDLYSIVKGVTGVDYATILVKVYDNTGLEVTSTKVDSFEQIPLQMYEILTMRNQPLIQLL